MNLWVWLLVGILVIISLILIFKKMNREKDYINLDDKLNSVKSKWNDCCKKIGKFFGA
ncbi:MAG: hypothetical protein AABY22_23385 [Nanoarchaeota archaeon]